MFAGFFVGPTDLETVSEGCWRMSCLSICSNRLISKSQASRRHTSSILSIPAEQVGSPISLSSPVFRPGKLLSKPGTMSVFSLVRNVHIRHWREVRASMNSTSARSKAAHHPQNSILVYCTDMTNPAVSSHHKFCRWRNVTLVISHTKNSWMVFATLKTSVAGSTSAMSLSGVPELLLRDALTWLVGAALPPTW